MRVVRNRSAWGSSEFAGEHHQKGEVGLKTMEAIGQFFSFLRHDLAEKNSPEPSK